MRNNLYIIYILLIISISQNSFSDDCTKDINYLVSNYSAKGIYRLGSSQTKVPRYGNEKSYNSPAYLNGLYEVEISRLRSIHPIPNPHRENSTINLKEITKKLQSKGYNIEFPIQVGVMPDGTLRILGGHHRAKALQILGELTIPAQVIIWSELPRATRKIYKETFFDEYKLIYPELYPELLMNPQIYD